MGRDKQQISLVGEAYDAWYYGLQTPATSGWARNYAVFLPLLITSVAYQYVSREFGGIVETVAYVLVSLAQITLLLSTAAAIQRFVASRQSLEEREGGILDPAGPMTSDYRSAMLAVSVPAFFALSGLANFIIAICIVSSRELGAGAMLHLTTLRDFVFNALIGLGGLAGMYVFRDELARAPILSNFGIAPAHATDGRRPGFRLGAILIAMVPILIYYIFCWFLVLAIVIAMSGTSDIVARVRPYHLFALLDVSVVWTLMRVLAGGTARLHVVLNGPVQWTGATAATAARSA